MLKRKILGLWNYNYLYENGLKTVGEFPNKATQFSSENQPEKNGRPRKWVSTLKEKGYKLSEVNDAIQVLIQMSREELTDIDNDETLAMLDRVVARAILASHDKKSLYNIETLLTRV